MFISTLTFLILIILLFLSGFDVAFAEKLLLWIIRNNFSQVIVAILLTGFFFNNIKTLSKISNLEKKFNPIPDNEKEKQITLSQQEIDEVINAVNSDEASLQKDNTLENSIANLGALVGLGSVKEEVKKLNHFIATQKKRESVGLPKQKINLHLVFTGNPGTGKTIVAREIAKIYKTYGLLEKGHLVETDRSGLVAEYIGQTAIKTKSVIESALGGVLFIDEAYSLTEEKGGFGKEAIDTLLKEMEDSRDKFVVIAAGYKKEMEIFINSNPGLKSRFSKTIHFEDYSVIDLLQIYRLLIKKNDYIIDGDATVYLANWLKKNPLGGKGFGNGRFMRNLYESTIVAQSSRINNQGLSQKLDLQLIVKEDIKDALNNTGI